MSSLRTAKVRDLCGVRDTPVGVHGGSCARPERGARGARHPDRGPTEIVPPGETPATSRPVATLMVRPERTGRFVHPPSL